MGQTVGTASTGTGSITISNAAKGETYTVYKLFDASITGTENGSIAYTGTIPDSLNQYFSYVNGTDGTNGITATAAATTADGSMSEGLRTALTEWAATATAAATAESDGSQLTFQGLGYGYYVIKTTQGDQAITVTSTNPNAQVVDKNSTTPVKDLKKDADNTDVNIGDTLTYTVSFGTANYTGEGTSAKQITAYKIEDTLPSFLTDVTVTSITIGDTAYTVDGAVPQFDTNKQIVIPWVDADGNNLYANGATVTIKYTATLADTAAIDGEGNTNKVTVTPQTKDGDDTPSKTEDSETVYTYAIALKKVNDKGEALSGAVFTLPFYVKTATDANGAYIYGGTEADEGLTNTVTTPASGEITIKGVKTGTYSITEATAPDGYNKLTTPVSVTATKTGETTTNTTTYLDADGNVTNTETETVVTYKNDNLAATAAVVVNKTGSTLPTTGGPGTAAMYAIGGLMVAAAAIGLIARRRAQRRRG